MWSLLFSYQPIKKNLINRFSQRSLFDDYTAGKETNDPGLEIVITLARVDSGQTLGMRQGINFDWLQANFPSIISEENIRNNRCFAK